MLSLQDRFRAFINNRWLVFVAAMWIQSCAGIGYVFGSISPVIKSSLNYNQAQIAMLGVFKDLGDSIGFIAGSLSGFLPVWVSFLIGAFQTLFGYGWVWLIVTNRVPTMPLWVMCILFFVGTNGETYFNTADLVSCVQNFPKSRGPVVGILKGFAGLSGAILTQIYAMINTSNEATMIFMIAVGPAVVVLTLMLIVRPVGGHRQVRPSDGLSFTFVYSVCLLLAAYLMGVIFVEDLVDLEQTVITLISSILFIILLLPIVIPILLSYSSEHKPAEESLIPVPQNEEPSKSGQDVDEVILSEVEDEKSSEVDLLSAPERKKKISLLQAKLFQAAAEGAVRVKRRKGPRRGEDFTLMQALKKADFWLIFISLVLGSGSGLAVIDNLGQMSESLGYDSTDIFVSMISIWNFIGRVGGGYFSEIVVRNYAFPRPVMLAVAQVMMAIGHFFFAMGWPGVMYVGTLLIGLGYGAHWSIVPAAASELFGLKCFAAMYNFLTLASPAGSLIFSGLIASQIYDYEAEKQADMPPPLHFYGLLHRVLNIAPVMGTTLKCNGYICYFLSSLIMCGFCLIAVVLSLILVYRTKIVYANLYGKSPTESGREL